MKSLLETIDTRLKIASKVILLSRKYPTLHGVPLGWIILCFSALRTGRVLFFTRSASSLGIPLNPPAQPLGLGPLHGSFWHLSQVSLGRVSFHCQLYDIDKACFQPHYLETLSLRYQIETQLTPTCYGASIQAWAKQGKASRLYLHAEDELTVEQVDKRIPCPSDKKANRDQIPKSSDTLLLYKWTRIFAVSQESGDHEFSKQSCWDLT